MRRCDRVTSREAALAVLAEARYGFLATAGPGGDPYAVAVNHVLEGNTIYIHSAPDGHKLENIRANPRACFTAVVDAAVIPEGHTTRYRSAVAFGCARLAGGEERRRALEALLDKFAPGHRAYSDCGAVAVIALDIERLTGKANAPG